MLVMGNQKNPQHGQATYKEIWGGEWKWKFLFIALI